MTNAVTEEDPKIDKLNALKKEYRVLESLKFKRTYEPHGFDLVMRLAASKKKDSNYLKLKFTGVKQLKMGMIEELMRTFIIEVSSIKKRQWEDLNYSVDELGEHAITFYCSDFDAKVTER